MIILDTNVISEPAKPAPDIAVVDWLDRQAKQTMYVTATTLAELWVGIELLPSGRKKNEIARTMSDLLRIHLGPRILPFDGSAALEYASIMVEATRRGRAISFADGQIAAIARVHGFTVATRNTSPFTAAGVAVVNPWEP